MVYAPRDEGELRVARGAGGELRVRDQRQTIARVDVGPALW